MLISLKFCNKKIINLLNKHNVLMEITHKWFKILNTKFSQLIIIGAALFTLLPININAQVAGPAKPNIVFVMVDDGRYDEYHVTGAPDWFEAPAIERIAHEGVNFTRTYAPTSMCAPSRASIYTGLYAHQHGVENNNYDFSDSLITIQKILEDQGYYTGFIGKYGQGFGAPNEFDYFVSCLTDDYVNTTYNVNGTTTFYAENSTTVLGNFVNNFLDSIQVHSDKPFALFLFTFAPHPPNSPQPIYKHIYDGLPVNFPFAWGKFPSLYPQFYYEGTSEWEKDSIATVKFIRDRLACIKGVDDVVANIFSNLDSHNLTDSTFFLYTSDNGYMEGDHGMRAKVLPIEESIHVPLFVKYAPWFGDSITIDNELVELTDIPATIADLIGQPDTFGFVGHSLRLLAEPDTMRYYVRYEYGGDDDEGLGNFNVPDLRGVRSFDYLYVESLCDCFTEELYDFINDPHQMTNQILNPDYQAIRYQYKAILDSLLLAVNDTTVTAVRDCALIGAYEIPDGIDQDCNGLIDDGITYKNWYKDFDVDGFGNSDSLIVSLYPVLGYVIDSTDCNDNNAAINPSEIDYCDGIDNNCDLIFDDVNVVPFITSANPFIFCPTTSITLNANPITPGFTMQWFKNDIIISGATTGSYVTSAVGIYKVKFTAPGAGCITESPTITTSNYLVVKPKVKNKSLSNNLTINNPVSLYVTKKSDESYQWYYNDIIIFGAATSKYSGALPGNYKIRVVDAHGCIAFSKNYLVIQTLREAEQELFVGDVVLTLFPNPATKNINVEFQSETNYNGDADIKIMNLLGQEIQTQKIVIMNGYVNEEINFIPGIASGVYVLQLIIGNQKWMQELVVSH